MKITLPYGYRIDEEDIPKTKKWMLMRNDNAMYLADIVEDLINDTLRKTVRLAYKYNEKPEDWHLTANRELFSQIEELMDKLEEDLYDVIQVYAVKDTDDNKDKLALLAWLIRLHGKYTKNLRETLHARLHQFLYDTEAQIAAMKLAGRKQTEAVGRVISTKFAVYSSQEMLSAFDRRTEANFIKLRGVHPGNVGLSSSGAVNIVNFARQTAISGWMRGLYLRYKKNGSAGYMCFRGSNFPCQMCDDVCGVVHSYDEGMVLPVHNSCMCYAVPVYQMTQQELINSQIQ